MPSVSVPLFISDAFTPSCFGGNPAAVCLVPERVTQLRALDATATPEAAAAHKAARDAALAPAFQRVAAEMNLSETAFLCRLPAAVEAGLRAADGAAPAAERAYFGLRWLTPKAEVDLCGHATLASAHVLFETARLWHAAAAAEEEALEEVRFLLRGADGYAADFVVPAATEELCFLTRSGVLRVRRAPGAGEGGAAAYAMSFPSNEATSVTAVLPADFVAALAAALRLPSAAAIVDVAVPTPRMSAFLVRLQDTEAVLAATPDAALVMAAFERPDVRAALADHLGGGRHPFGVATTARNLERDKFGGAAVISRFFSPWVGVPEDPVTGSWHTALAPYWLRRLDPASLAEGAALRDTQSGDSLLCYQASARGGAALCELQGAGEEARVVLSAPAATFLRGKARLNL